MLARPVEGIFVGFSSSASCADASLQLISLLSSAIEASRHRPSPTLRSQTRRAFRNPFFGSSARPSTGVGSPSPDAHGRRRFDRRMPIYHDSLNPLRGFRELIEQLLASGAEAFEIDLGSPIPASSKVLD